jgi:hypothetical protein
LVPNGRELITLQRNKAVITIISSYKKICNIKVTASVTRQRPDRWIFVKITQLNSSLFEMNEYILYCAYKYDQIIFLYVVMFNKNIM